MEEELQQNNMFEHWKYSLSWALCCWMVWRGEVGE